MPYCTPLGFAKGAWKKCEKRKQLENGKTQQSAKQYKGQKVIPKYEISNLSVCYLSGFALNGYSRGSAMDLKEANHVLFVNHHLFASPGNYHNCHTKQHAFGLQVVGLAFSDIYYSLDFLFLSHWWSNCGGFGLAKAGEEIPSWKEYEQGDPEIEGKDSRVGKKRCWRVSDRIALP
jgi:hypothetical protein